MSPHAALSTDDGRLVDLVDAVLVDPDVHTDLRMRLHEEIADLVAQTGHELRARTMVAQAGAPAPASAQSGTLAPTSDRPETGDPGLAQMLHAVLVDPNLHDDLRMRLHQEIPVLIAAHREAAKTET